VEHIVFTVYVLRSTKNCKKYVGFTSKTAKQRLFEHNNRCNKWTRDNKPFILLYEEHYQTKKEAQLRERFLKSGQGRKFLNSTLS